MRQYPRERCPAPMSSVAAGMLPARLVSLAEAAGGPAGAAQGVEPVCVVGR